MTKSALLSTFWRNLYNAKYILLGIMHCELIFKSIQGYVY